MPRITIQQFRAALDGRSDGSTLVRAYRELARRPELAASSRLDGWGDWSTPPARS